MSAVSAIARSGVIPLPPPINTTGASLFGRYTNRPAAGRTDNSIPAVAVSFSHPETRPPGTRFTQIPARSDPGAVKIE